MKNPYEYQKGKYVDIVLSGVDTRLHPGNTHVFSHILQSEGNHIYVIHRPIDDESVEASYLWRLNFKEQKRADKYDELASRLGKIACQVHEELFMTESDSNRFQSSFGRPAAIDVVEHKLTQRHELEIGRFALNLDRMPARDIHEEMQFPHDYRPHPQRWA